jgi:hypothetical protein
MKNTRTATIDRIAARFDDPMSTEMRVAKKRLARMAGEMRGVLSQSGRWFDLPDDEDAVGYGIITGRYGIAIVSVPR